MIISQASKYGIRAAVYLAEHEVAPVLSRSIAGELDIPEHFLAKILQDLSRNHLLDSFKGRGGGFRLARPASQIKLLNIVEAIEGPQFGQECLLGLSECTDASPCPLHYQWADIRARILRMLEQTSLQHVVDKSFPRVQD